MGSACSVQFVDGLSLAAGEYVQIDARFRGAGVAHQLGDDGDVDAPVHKMRGERVPQHLGRDRLGDIGSNGRFANDRPDVLLPDRPPLGFGQEEPPPLGLPLQKIGSSSV